MLPNGDFHLYAGRCPLVEWAAEGLSYGGDAGGDSQGRGQLDAAPGRGQLSDAAADGRRAPERRTPDLFTAAIRFRDEAQSWQRGARLTLSFDRVRASESGELEMYREPFVGEIRETLASGMPSKLPLENPSPTPSQTPSQTRSQTPSQTPPGERSPALIIRPAVGEPATSFTIELGRPNSATHPEFYFVGHTRYKGPPTIKCELSATADGESAGHDTPSAEYVRTIARMEAGLMREKDHWKSYARGVRGSVGGFSALGKEGGANATLGNATLGNATFPATFGSPTAAWLASYQPFVQTNSETPPWGRERAQLPMVERHSSYYAHGAGATDEGGASLSHLGRFPSQSPMVYLLSLPAFLIGVAAILTALGRLRRLRDGGARGRFARIGDGAGGGAGGEDGPWDDGGSAVAGSTVVSELQRAGDDESEQMLGDRMLANSV